MLKVCLYFGSMPREISAVMSSRQAYAAKSKYIPCPCQLPCDNRECQLEEHPLRWLDLHDKKTHAAKIKAADVCSCRAVAVEYDFVRDGRREQVFAK